MKHLRILVPICAMALTLSPASASDSAVERAVDSQDRFATLHGMDIQELKGEFISSYFPVKVGYTWAYSDKVSGENFDINIVGRQTIRGQNAWKIERTRANMANDYDLVTIDDQNGADVHFRFVRGNQMDLSPAVKMTAGQMATGQVFETEPVQRNPATGNTTIWRSKIEGFESKTVPAGTYNCVKVRLLVRDSKLGTKFADVTMWYGKGVGLVARQGQFFGVYLVEDLNSTNVP